MFIVQKRYLATFFKISFVSYLVAIAVAIFYQEYLGSKACVICIHIRVIVILLGLISALSFLSNKRQYLNRLIFIPYSIFSFIGVYKSYTGYKVEIGDLVSGCTMDPGFPSYFKLDDWAPYIFRPEGLCGERLLMFGDITMMMLSMIMFSVFLLIAIALFLLDIVLVFWAKKHRL